MTYIVVLLVVLIIVGLYMHNQKSRMGTQTLETGGGLLPYMLDLFYLPKGTKNRMGWNGRIIQKHVDFVICNPKTLEPVTCIELDDSSHDIEERTASRV